MSFTKTKFSNNLQDRKTFASKTFASNVYPVQTYITQDKASRSMSINKGSSTILSLLLGLFLAFCSFFYLPAYISNSFNEKITLLDSLYLNHLLKGQGYFKSGQTVTVDYKMSPGTELSFSVTKCSGPLIVEIYSCRGTLVKTFKVTEVSNRFNLVMGETGFYTFDQKLTNDSTKNSIFEVNWMRK
ncbi:MAG: hypothetical protein ABJ275_01690 [Maricaulaceae bacterium]